MRVCVVYVLVPVEAEAGHLVSCSVTLHCVCVCAWVLCVLCVRVWYVFLWRLNQDIWYFVLPLILETGFLDKPISRELAVLPRVSGHQALGVYLSPLQCCGYRHWQACLAVYVGN